MSYVVRLVKGTKAIDLMSGGYSANFTPPRTSITASYAGGTSINKYGGAQKVTERATNGSVSFEVRMTGNSTGEIDTLTNQIEWMLRQAGDAGEPLYLEWKTDTNVSFEPIWGQYGASRRLQVEHGWLDRWGMHSVANLRAKTSWVTVYLETRPFAMGKRQRLASASGSVSADIGLADNGISRGTIISVVGSNLVNNPIALTAATSWTANGAGSSVARKTEDGPVGICNTCIEVFAADVASSGVLIQSAPARMTVVAANNYTGSVYLKCTSAASLTLQLYITWYSVVPAVISSSTQNITVTNEWARYSITGVSPAGAVTALLGIQRVAVGIQIYRATAAQFENYSQKTAFYTGDYLGCNWAGTAHASVSNRVAGQAKLPVSEINIGSGTMVFAWKTGMSELFGLSQYFFDTDTVSLRGYFNQADETLNFGDGTNTATSAALTFAAGTWYVLHFVWSTSVGLEIWANGVRIANSATYTIPGVGTYLWLGSSNAASGQNNGTLSVSIYPHAMSTAEIAATYADVARLVANDIGIGDIPWLWTKDGDDIVDNSDSGADENWAVCGGIPGNSPANTYIGIVCAMNAAADDSLYLSLLDIPPDQFEKPDALTSNGAPDTISIDTTVTTLTTFTLTAAQNRYLAGREILAIVRGRVPTTDNLSLIIGINPNGTYYYSDYGVSSFVIHGSNTSIDTSPSLMMVTRNKLFSEMDHIMTGTLVIVRAKRSTGAAENFYLTSVQLVPRPFIRFNTYKSTVYGWIYANDQAYYIDADDKPALQPIKSIVGDKLELKPNNYNVLIANKGFEAVSSTTTHDIEFFIYVIPRWSIT